MIDSNIETVTLLGEIIAQIKAGDYQVRDIDQSETFSKTNAGTDLYSTVELRIRITRIR